MGGSSKLLPYDHVIEKLELSIKYRLIVFYIIVLMAAGDAPPPYGKGICYRRFTYQILIALFDRQT